MATNMNLKSRVRAYFIRNPVCQTAECKLCKAKLKSTGGSNACLVQQVYYARKFTLAFVTTHWTNYVSYVQFIVVVNPLHSVTHIKNSVPKQSLITDGRLASSFVLRMPV